MTHLLPPTFDRRTSALATYLLIPLLLLISSAVTAATDVAVAPSLQFKPCPENAALECARLRVPIDYSRPYDTTELAVIRAKATNPAQRIGVLFGNPGGPGASGVNFVLGGVQAPIGIKLREHFDIVSFDPRGTHRSGAISCTVQPVGEMSDVPDAQRAHLLNNYSTSMANECMKQHPALVRSMSTNNIARDVDRLRAALGERKISFLGVSFGTELGAVYASLYPGRVRALLLDAGIAPEFRDGLTEFVVTQTDAFEFALQHIDTLCRDSSTCPLREQGVIATFDAVRALLKRSPAQSESGLLLDDVTARNVVADLLYAEPAWPLIPRMLAAALGGDYSLFFSRLPVQRDRIRLAVHDTVLDGYDIILCNDYGTRRPAEQLLTLDKTAGRRNPRFFGDSYVAAELARCAAWPKADVPKVRNLRWLMRTPALLIGNEVDPATPLAWTRRLASALGMEAHVVRYAGGGHGAVTFGLPCTDKVALDYLIHLRLPPEGTTCNARQIVF